MNGDVKLVINCADNIASGMLSYSNLCTAATITMPGKPATTKAPECVSARAKRQKIELHINLSNALTFAGQTSTGAKLFLLPETTRRQHDVRNIYHHPDTYET